MVSVINYDKLEDALKAAKIKYPEAEEALIFVAVAMMPGMVNLSDIEWANSVTISDALKVKGD